ncbi:MoxR family ATPase [Aestuariirhabdus sp. Z084]|uniref:AAA family ATPase n=1 Tax=Aestuariirhabdus haliotis TaxID=2918751 RepID=UPI00201B39A4|nr:MoxR family ATPase [Aestuariirhabdus haliotis]MCL6416443.1 MoxR family ATPase [Aestuariirhabdus haliotis]MCL6420390.1 MoxR family ATPase [Aestuariirhabdus haliotis]
MELHAQLKQIQQQMNAALIGQSDLVDKLLLALLCNGNLLLEGLPGTAKTRAIKTLATALNVELGRIQFTPDLLPSDVTGTEIYHQDGEHQTLTFAPGPIFASLVLADEINRAPAKVQSALLEAMEERQVTVAGTSYPLPELFMVLATQNPIEQEGTYPLPEAQMDRFLMKVAIDYPDDDAERTIMRLVRAEEQPTSDQTRPEIEPQTILAAREAIRQLHVAESVEDYMVALVMATRHPQRYTDSPMASWIDTGASPRATIALDRTARAQAWLQGREFVDPDDVRAVVAPVLRHRIRLSYEALAEGIDSDRVIAELVRQVAVA